MKDLSLHFLEIPKFQKKEHMTRIERWLAMFSKKLTFKEKEAIARKDPIMKDVIDSYDLFFSDDKERHNYINREMEILDYNSSIKSATDEGRKEGREEGIKQGIQQGVAQEKENNFVALAKDGVPSATILRALKVSKEELAAILKKHPELQDVIV